MKLLYPFFLLLLTASVSPAQQLPPDFVVKASGDTVRGKIRKMAREEEPAILLHDGTRQVSFSSADVSSYGEVNGPVFVKKRVGPQQQPVFLRPLIVGYLSLYSKTAGEVTRFYLQPRDSAYAIEVVPATAQLTFHRLLGECPGLNLGTEQGRQRYPYTYQGMRRLVQDYNTCRMPEQPMLFVAPGTGWTVRWGLKAGINRTTFTEYEEVVESRANARNLGYQLGGTVHFQRRSHFSFQLEAMLLLLRGVSTPADVYTGTTLYSQTASVDIKYFQLQIPLLLRYRFGNKNLQPYVNAGLSAGINGGKSTTLINRYQYANRLETKETLQEKPDPLSFGYAAGLGVLFNPAAGPAFSLEARMDHMIDRLRNSYYRPRHTSLRLDLGIVF